MTLGRDGDRLTCMLKIGETIRGFRTQRGLSQGDIEKRTGLLRCYLSRVENGHTTPSLQTLSKLALALELPLSHFFTETPGFSNTPPLPSLSEEEVLFLSQMRQYSSGLSDTDRQRLLAMVKQMAQTAGVER